MTQHVGDGKGPLQCDIDQACSFKPKYPIMKIKEMVVNDFTFHYLCP